MDPVAFSIFGLDIMWYGILVTGSIVIASLLSFYQFEESQANISKDEFWDLVLVVVVSGILGARLYYVIFYDLGYYLSNPLQILNFRQGGLAIYGGIIGGILAGFLYSRKKKANFWYIFDIISPSLALAQSIARWGNYINQEAYGGPTDLPWAIEVDGVMVHPTFLYESIGNFFLFLFLFFYLRKRKKFHGQIAASYMIGYGLLRFFVEGFRVDSLYFGPFRVSQLVSILGIVLGILIYYYRGHKKGKLK